MPVYVWEGMVRGKVQKGELEAPSKSAVLARLRQMQVQPIPDKIKEKGKLFLGPVLTSFGKISVTVRDGEEPRISWQARWHKTPAKIEIRVPGFAPTETSPSEEGSITLKKGEKRK